MNTTDTKKKNSFLSRVRAAFGNQGTSAATVISRICRSEGFEAALTEALLSFPTAQRGYMLLHLRDGVAIDEAKAQTGYVDADQPGAKAQAEMRERIAEIEAAKERGEFAASPIALLPVGANPQSYHGGVRLHSVVR